jgi:hypothetical protein
MPPHEEIKSCYEEKRKNREQIKKENGERK